MAAPAVAIVEGCIALAGLIYGYYSSRRAASDMSSGQPKLGNNLIQTSAYGGPIPIIYGRCRVAGNVIWYGNYVALSQTQSVGGKGGGADTVSYTYTASVALALCMGTIVDVATIWRDKKKQFGYTRPRIKQNISEYHLVPSSGAHTTTVGDSGLWVSDSGTATVWNNASGLVATLVLNTDYTVAAGGVYTFTNSLAWAAGNSVRITYAHKAELAYTDVLTAIGGNVTLFNGASSQLPWSAPPSAEQLAYRNLAYVALANYPLSQAATLGNHSFEVDASLQYGLTGAFSQAINSGAISDVTEREGVTRNFGNTFSPVGSLKTNMAVRLSGGGLPPGFSATTTYFVNVGTSNYTLALSPGGPPVRFSDTGSGTVVPFIVDASPSAVINDLLTNALYGAGYPSNMIGDLTAMTQYTVASDLWVSPCLNAQKACVDMVNTLCTVANTAPFFSEGMLKFTPLGDSSVSANAQTYTPSLTPMYDLTDDDFVEDQFPVMTRKPQADAWNHVQVKYLNRFNNYIEEIAEAKDQAAIDTYGLRTMNTVTLTDMVCNPITAQNIAQLMLQRVLYLRNQWAFQLTPKHMLVEPGDILSITDSALGLSTYAVRIIATEEQMDGAIAVTAEDLPGTVASAADRSTQLASPTLVDVAADPGPTFQPMIFDAPSTITEGRFEVWLAASGGDNWGGCDVYAAWDNVTYQKVGRILGHGRYGVTSASFASGADPDTTDTLSVDLTLSQGAMAAASATDCDAFVTLCYVDGELISYQGATLTSQYNYNLGTRIRRGVYGSTVAAHASGSQFVRLDSTLFKMAYDPARVGQKIYFKLVAFNLNGNTIQGLADAVPYSYVLRGKLGVPAAPTSLTATAVADGVKLTWSGPQIGPFVAAFNIYRDGSLRATVTANAYQDHVTDASTHSYYVKAVNYQGAESAASNTLSGISTNSRGQLVFTYASAASSSEWVKLGTWNFAGDAVGHSLELDFAGGAGFNSGSAQQSSGSVFAQSGNAASAPNISGASFQATGTALVLALKLKAVGGSTSASNGAWDVYVQLAAHGTSNWTIIPGTADSFTWAGLGGQSDPGSASSSLVVGAGQTTHDTGGVANPGSVDMSRGYTNKNLDNIADTGTYSRTTTGAVQTSNLQGASNPTKFYQYIDYGVADNTTHTLPIPNGAKQLVIRGWGPGGSGSVKGTGTTGCGGGGGAAFKKTVQINSTDWGLNLTYKIGAGGAGFTVAVATNGNPGSAATTVTTTGTSFGNLNLSAGAGGGATATVGGTAGIASGGDTNTSGVAGDTLTAAMKGGSSAAVDGIQGAGGAQSSQGTPPGSGGGGDNLAINNPGTAGAGRDGMIQFIWS